MNEQELESFLEKNRKGINSSNAEKTLKRVYEMINDRRVLYDFIGQVLIEKPELQEGKKHAKFLKGYNTFLSKMNFENWIPPRELLKLEKYFLEKYCIFEGEEILCSFFGLVEYNLEQIYFHTRVFITNYRIIISDVLRTSGGIPFIPMAGITSNILGGIINLILKPGKMHKTKSAEPINAGKVSYGYNFPLLNLTSIHMSMMTKKKKFKAPYLKAYFPIWKKGMNSEKAYSIRFVTETQSGPCTLSIYVNHQALIFEAEREYEDGQEMLHKIREILQTLQ